MANPNEPIIDTRSTVVDGQQTAIKPNGNVNAADTSSNDGGSSSTTIKATTTDPISTTVPEQYTASSYAELIPQLEKRVAEYKPLSEKDLEKLRKKQRAEGIISGISDAVQSVANLMFTHQYAPNMYNPKEGMSAKAKARFDKAKAEREAEDDRWFNYALTLGKLRDADDDKRFKQQQQSAALQLKINEDARRQAKADYDAEMADIDLQVKLGKLDYERARKRIAEAKATLQEAYASHADEIVASEIGKNNRSGAGGGSKKVWSATDKDGKVHQFVASSTDQAYSIAGANGWTIHQKSTSSTRTTTTKDPYGGTSTSTTTTTKGAANQKVEIDWK